MTRYTVTLQEIADYEVRVEADSVEAAEALAEERFIDEGCTEFPVTVHEREVASIEEGW